MPNINSSPHKVSILLKVINFLLIFMLLKVPIFAFFWLITVWSLELFFDFFFTKSHQAVGIAFAIVYFAGIIAHALWIVLRQAADEPPTLKGKIIGSYLFTLFVFCLIALVTLSWSLNVFILALAVSTNYLPTIAAIEFTFHLINKPRKVPS